MVSDASLHQIESGNPDQGHYHAVLVRNGAEAGRCYAPTRAIARRLGRRLRTIALWGTAVHERACFDDACAPVLAPAWPRDEAGRLLDRESLELLTDPARDLRFAIGTEDEYWAVDCTVLPDAVELAAIIQERDADTLDERHHLVPRDQAEAAAECLIEAAWAWLAQRRSFDHSTTPEIDQLDAERATERFFDALAAAIEDGR